MSKIKQDTTMKELINGAENIRAKLLEVMLNIPYDFEPDYTIAITLAADFLKKLIERKDNIVDLSEVWHNVAEEPDRTKDILIDSYTFGYYTPSPISFREQKWNHCISNYAIKRWAYVDDFLPKGGE